MRPFNRQPPLFKGLVVIVLDMLGGLQRSLQSGRFDRLQHGCGDRAVNLHCPDVQAQRGPVLERRPAPAVITGRGDSPRVMGRQTATALTAHGKPLEQRGAFAHGALSGSVRPRTGILCDAAQNRFMGLPVDVAAMVIVDKGRPFGTRQLANAFAHRSVLVGADLLSCPAISVGAGIHRARQNPLDDAVGRRSPAQLLARHPNRKIQLLPVEPAPDLAHRPELGEAREDRMDRALDLLVGVDQDLAVAVAANVAWRQPVVEFAARRLVADPSVESGAKDYAARPLTWCP